MPRIDDAFLDSVIYLYPDEPSADAGEKAGGSGFLVGIYVWMRVEQQRIRLPAWHLYAVSNDHVVRGGSCTVRLNDVHGSKIVYETKEIEWISHPNGDDIAVCNVDLHPQIYQLRFVEPESFLTQEVMDYWSIGPGDNTFMVGRFINHEGKQRNLPSVRFGNIAQMPKEKIRQEFRGNFDQESFLVECRAIGGYSGSPVFVYISDTERRPDRPLVIGEALRPHLLGVEWGVLSKWEPVCDDGGRPVGSPRPDNLQVDVNSGMMGVVPVWKLREILDLPVFADRRKEEEEAFFKRHGAAAAPAAAPTDAGRRVKVTPPDETT